MGLSQPLTGGCYCGAIRYESTKPPVRCAMCHCRMCQSWLGVAAAMGVFFASDSFRFTQGEPAKFMTSKILARYFCRDCGGALGHWYQYGVFANINIVLVGTLDDPSRANGPSVYFGVEDHLSEWIPLVEGRQQERADTSKWVQACYLEAERNDGDKSDR